MKNYELLRSLHFRGETTTTLAQKIGSCQSHVSQTLANDPGRGARTRRKLARLLTPEELVMAGWNEDGSMRGTTSPPGAERESEAAGVRETQFADVPCGALSQPVE
jgi:hypothetical protein